MQDGRGLVLARIYARRSRTPLSDTTLLSRSLDFVIHDLSRFGESFGGNGERCCVSKPQPILIVYRLAFPRTNQGAPVDRKSTRLNSSHLGISYAVFCLKKKNIIQV